MCDGIPDRAPDVDDARTPLEIVLCFISKMAVNPGDASLRRLVNMCEQLWAGLKLQHESRISAYRRTP